MDDSAQALWSWSRQSALILCLHPHAQFVVVTAPDARFERRGSDLHHNATISLVDALVGFSTEVRVSTSEIRHRSRNTASQTSAVLGTRRMAPLLYLV